MPEDERARIEDRLFADDQLHEQIEAVKSELADDYVRGELTFDERWRFERRFLNSPQDRDRVAYARAMAQGFSELRAEEAAASEPAVSPPVSWRQSLLTFLRERSLAIQFALAAATLIFMFGGVWLLREIRQMRAQVELAQQSSAASQRERQELQRQVADQIARGDELAAQLEREQAERERLQKELDQPQSRTPAFFSFILSPGLIRGADEPEKLVAPKSARQIRLQLDLNGADSYRSYRAEIRTARGNLVWSQDALPARSTSIGKSVFVTLPASALANGEYELTLRGVINQGKLEDIGYYYFNVIKR